MLVKSVVSSIFAPSIDEPVVYGQALARLSSAKQTSDHIHVVHVFSSQLELKMIRALRDGQKMNAVIADAFTQATKESIL